MWIIRGESIHTVDNTHHGPGTRSHHSGFPKGSCSERIMARLMCSATDSGVQVASRHPRHTFQLATISWSTSLQRIRLVQGRRRKQTIRHRQRPPSRKAGKKRHLRSPRKRFISHLENGAQSLAANPRAKTTILRGRTIMATRKQTSNEGRMIRQESRYGVSSVFVIQLAVVVRV